MKIKERIKNIVLALLIISSVCLTLNIWFDKKLCPDGYNFFSDITQKIFGQKVLKNSGSLSKEKLALPKQLVVNNASKRSIFYETDDAYDTIIAPVKSIFISALTSDNYTKSTSDEWNSALKAKSIFVSYPVAYDSEVLGNILGVQKVKTGSMTIRDFIISQGYIASSSLYVYIRDYTDQSIKKCSVRYDKKEFENLLTRYAGSTTGDLPYSFELNFDKINSDSQNVTISPDVVLSINRTKHSSLYSINPVFSRSNEDFDSETVDTILKKFSFNINTARKYTEPDGAIVYVENYGSIKIHPSGYFEYKAIAPDKGVSLPVDADADFNSIFTASLNFVTDFWTGVVPQSELNLSLTGDIVNKSLSDVEFTMNYYINGTLIRDDIQNALTGEISPYALTMNVSNGKITAYKQLIRIYYTGDTDIENISTIEALDKLFASKEDLKNTNVREIFPAYINEGGIYAITYAAKSDSGKTVLIR